MESSHRIPLNDADDEELACSDNWKPYFPFGARGVFQGATLIFYSYGGYYASANMAEEVSSQCTDRLLINKYWCQGEAIHMLFVVAASTKDA